MAKHNDWIVLIQECWEWLQLLLSALIVLSMLKMLLGPIIGSKIPSLGLNSFPIWKHMNRTLGQSYTWLLDGWYWVTDTTIGTVFRGKHMDRLRYIC
jgi:hypothetical protein